MRHHNKSMTIETTTNTGKNQKLSRQVREESVEAIFFSANFYHDPLKVFSEPVRVINFRTM